MINIIKILVICFITNIAFFNIIFILIPIYFLNYKYIIGVGVLNIIFLLLPLCKNNKKNILINCIAERHNIKIIEEEPNQILNSNNTLLPYHPHGNFPIGFICYVNEIYNTNIIPAISWRALYVPFIRVLLYINGSNIITISKKVLNKTIINNNILFIPGGIQEMLLTTPNKDINISIKHKGFIELALNNGSDIVPIFCFGENDLIHSISKIIEKYTYNKLKILLPTIYINDNNLPITNKKVKLIYVIGKKIKMPKIYNPSKKKIDKYHKIYYNNIKRIYYKYKDISLHENRDIRFIN